MHNEDVERPSEHEDTPRAAITAADDTGLVKQQEILVHAELGDQDAAVEGGVE